MKAEIHGFKEKSSAKNKMLPLGFEQKYPPKILLTVWADNGSMLITMTSDNAMVLSVKNNRDVTFPIGLFVSTLR